MNSSVRMGLQHPSPRYSEALAYRVQMPRRPDLEVESNTRQTLLV